MPSYGGVPERLNGTVSKTVVEETPPRVRIPAPPPNQSLIQSDKVQQTRIYKGCGFFCCPMKSG